MDVSFDCSSFVTIPSTPFSCRERAGRLQMARASAVLCAYDIYLFTEEFSSLVLQSVTCLGNGVIIARHQRLLSISWIDGQSLSILRTICIVMIQVTRSMYSAFLQSALRESRWYLITPHAGDTWCGFVQKNVAGLLTCTPNRNSSPAVARICEHYNVGVQLLQVVRGIFLVSHCLILDNQVSFT